MWSRDVEVMLGCWLLISPFVFQHPPEATPLWANDFACGTAAMVFALLSYWRPLRRAHLVTMGVGAWLIGFAFAGATPPVPAALQNDAILGLLLLMFAVIPNEATRPPRSWRSPASNE